MATQSCPCASARSCSKNKGSFPLWKLVVGTRRRGGVGERPPPTPWEPSARGDARKRQRRRLASCLPSFRVFRGSGVFGQLQTGAMQDRTGFEQVAQAKQTDDLFGSSRASCGQP